MAAARPSDSDAGRVAAALVAALPDNPAPGTLLDEIQDHDRVTLVAPGPGAIGPAEPRVAFRFIVVIDDVAHGLVYDGEWHHLRRDLPMAEAGGISPERYSQALVDLDAELAERAPVLRDRTVAVDIEPIDEDVGPDGGDDAS